VGVSASLLVEVSAESETFSDKTVSLEGEWVWAAHFHRLEIKPQRNLVSEDTKEERVVTVELTEVEDLGSDGIRGRDYDERRNSHSIAASDSDDEYDETADIVLRVPVLAIDEQDSSTHWKAVNEVDDSSQIELEDKLYASETADSDAMEEYSLYMNYLEVLKGSM
jgi:hypothetical protein